MSGETIYIDCIESGIHYLNAIALTRNEVCISHKPLQETPNLQKRNVGTHPIRHDLFAINFFLSFFNIDRFDVSHCIARTATAFAAASFQPSLDSAKISTA